MHFHVSKNGRQLCLLQCHNMSILCIQQFLSLKEYSLLSPYHSNLKNARMVGLFQEVCKCICIHECVSTLAENVHCSLQELNLSVVTCHIILN